MAFPEVSRRRFIQLTSSAAAAVSISPFYRACAANPVSSEPVMVADLPQGTAPAPLSLAHFPDRLHAFVWRNWTLVPADRMAVVIGARTKDVLRLGRSMGLSGPPRITQNQQVRSYITVIKRNWHLLPYEQILELLGWSPAQMAYTLQEDDFLFVKLGRLKPKCQPLRYQEPGPAATAHAQRITRIFRDHLGDPAKDEAEPLFQFVTELSSRQFSAAPRSPRSKALKYCYSYFALYGDPLLESEADPYPEHYLERLSQADVTGVWLQAVLYKLAEFPWDPSLSAHREQRLANLKRLVARAQKHGIGVFLYLNEPRAMPARFFQTHPELKGASEGDHTALCTSNAEVRRYLSEAVTSICTAVPGLGGFFTITASENFTNCWSHGGGANCPRCAKRPAAEVIAELNGAFAEGIRKSKSSSRLLAWDWGWDDKWAGDAIKRLPAEVSLMSVSEWRLPVERGGVNTEVGEYSISAVGPGPRATEHWRLARDRGLRTVAKVQAGNTWELSSVPYIPAVANVARHAENLARAQVSDFMLGWTLGGYPSPNLEAFSETLVCSSAEEGMRRTAERRFGSAAASMVVSAWKDFSTAFCEFPYHGGVVYSGPQQLGPANLLWSEPTGYAATMVGFPYDDLDAWRAVYPADVFVGQFEKMASGFEVSLEKLKRNVNVQGLAPAEAQQFMAECRVAEASAIHFRSSANQARFILARRALSAAKTQADARPQIAALAKLLTDETRLAARLYQLQRADSRLGFEASNHYFYVPSDLAEKVLNCRHLLDDWLPRQRDKWQASAAK